MHIHPISHSNYKQNFGAGRTVIYSDFDSSYMPYSHNDICTNYSVSSDVASRNEFNNLYRSFARFIDLGKKTIDFVLTTGRSQKELEHFVSKLESQNLLFHQPEELITRDGANRFVKAGFKYVPNVERNNIVKDMTGFDRTVIEQDVKKLIKDIDNRAYIVDSVVNKDAVNYETFSLEHKLYQISSDNKRYYAAFAKDEPLNVEIALSKELDANHIAKQVEKYLAENNIKAQVKMYAPDNYVWLPVYDNGDKYHMEPANMLHIKPIVDGKIINKLYDVKNQVRKNIEEKNDDLVIVMGDACNDEAMLNPLNYLDIYGYKVDKTKPMEEVLKDKNVLKMIKQLPASFIICGYNEDLNHLHKMREILVDNNIHNKIIISKRQQDDMVNCFKDAMYQYGEDNSDYKYSLPPELFEAVMRRGLALQ